MEITLVLSLLVIAIFLFSTEKLSVDVVTIILLVILTATKILTPTEAFAGFGSDFIIILASIYIISGALQQTGMLDLIGSRLLKIARTKPNMLVSVIMFTVGATSAFMNNTTVTAIYIAPVISLARKIKINPSRLLMPVAYASILGGTCTLIGTSTNIAVSGYLEKSGMKPLGMFEFLPVGLTIFFIGLVYMATIGKRLLPDHKDQDFTEEFGLRQYMTEVVVLPGSALIGQKIFSSDIAKTGFRILNVIRGKENFLPDKSTIICAEDILIVEGNIDDLLKVKEASGIEIRADVLVNKDLQSNDIRLAEVLVTPQSDFVNVSLKNANFRQRYGLVVLAINRSGQALREKIGSIVLHVGDILLVQGRVEKINYFKANRDITIMEDFKPLLYKKRKGLMTLSIFVGAMVIGASDVLPLSTALLLASLLIVLCKAISVEKAYETIDWKLLIMIGGMSAFGTAMIKSGAADFLAHNIVGMMSRYGPEAIMAGFIVLTVFLTQPMSNAAAALVVLPVALQTAQQMGISGRPFAIAVMLSASVSLITPLEPSCILVYGPGRYRFVDFFKTGFLLTVILMMVLMLMIPYYWPF
ncbi:MAG: SLC13 family permease [Bacteroidetes bacterium]|nr:SLC13 family permease [Bacteroidota bacterium]